MLMLCHRDKDLTFIYILCIFAHTKNRNEENCMFFPGKWRVKSSSMCCQMELNCDSSLEINVVKDGD